MPRIVVGVDFSVASLNAARWVARALGPDVELVLVHALPALGGGDLHDTDTRARSTVGALRGLAGLLRVRRVTAVARRGSVADVLTGVAAEMRARVICIGRDHVDGLPARRLTARLLERGPSGVLVVPRTSHDGVRPSRIAVALDAGDVPGPALHEAILLLAGAAREDRGAAARLVVVRHAGEHRRAGGPGATGAVVAELTARDLLAAVPPGGRVEASAAAWLAHRVQASAGTGASAERDQWSGEGKGPNEPCDTGHDADIDVLVLAHPRGPRGSDASERRALRAAEHARSAVLIAPANGVRRAAPRGRRAVRRD